MYKAKAYSAASATSPLAATTIPRRDTTERDVQIEILFCGICHSDLHYGAQRVEQRHAHHLSLRAGPRDRRPGHQGRRGSHQVQAGRPGGRRLPGRFGPHLPQLPGWPRAVLPEPDPHLQLPGQAPAAASPTAATPKASSSMSASSCASPPTSISPGSRRCSAPGSRPTRRCAAGATSRGRRSAWSASAGWVTWGSSSPAPSAPTSWSSPPRPSKKEDALRLGAA